jgi:hypothetical protein
MDLYQQTRDFEDSLEKLSLQYVSVFVCIVTPCYPDSRKPVAGRLNRKNAYVVCLTRRHEGMEAWNFRNCV